MGLFTADARKAEEHDEADGEQKKQAAQVGELDRKLADRDGGDEKVECVPTEEYGGRANIEESS